MVSEALAPVEQAQTVLRWAVIWERQKHTSWEEIGERLAASRGSPPTSGTRPPSTSGS